MNQTKIHRSRGRTRFARLTAPCVVTLSLALTLSACGGSAVEDPYAAQVDAGAGTTATDTLAGGAADAASGGGLPGSGTAAGAQPGVPAGTAAGTTTTTGGTTGGTAATGKEQPGATSGTPAKAGGAQMEGGLGGGVQRAVAALPIFGGTQGCKPATLSEVPIGNVSTLSGVLGELFAPAKFALETFVASQNACGGLNGHRIKYIVADDQGDPSTAITKVQELINKKVLAFVGNFQVTTVDAIVPTINKSGIPVIGSDLTTNSWFTSPMIFPQGSSVQSMAYGDLVGVRDYHKKKTLGVVYCLEAARACEQWNRALGELAPTMGIQIKKTFQASLTAPSYVQQCLELKSANVEVVGIGLDAASQRRFARSCTQTNYFPKVVVHPVGLGNEQQFLGEKWLGDTWVPINSFPWLGNTTGPEKYYQAMVKKYNPNAPQGGAATLGWAAGAMLVAAAANLPAENPTTQSLLDTLHSFQGQKFTELGGMTGPKTFTAGANPKVPYCYFAAIANDQGTGWKRVDSRITCSKVVAPSDPLSGS